MSFSGTPLGQGRRLDHSAFLGKPSTNNINRAPSPNLTLPTSYTYGAPTVGHRPATLAQEHEQGSHNNNDSASTRRKPPPLSRSIGPQITTQPPNPETWIVKDTTVNIAAAFNQATAGMQNPNNAWATGANRPNPAIPRSTSVEYENEAAKTAHRRLAAPPPRRGPRPPVSKSASSHNIPDSEEERLDRSTRGKSPLAHVMDAAKRVIGQATFYAQEPQPQEPTNGNDSSYDYGAEESEYQAKNAANRAHRRKRMSVDNKAYKPTASDEEDDDAVDDDDKRKRRRSSKKGAPGGPLTSLPTIPAQKKKRRGKTTKGGAQEDEATDEEEASGDDAATEASAAHARARSASRTSVPPLAQPPQVDADDSMDVEQGLNSIPEVEDEELEQAPRPRSRATTPARAVRPWSIGGFLGILVNWMGRMFMASLYAAGRSVGSIWDVLLRIQRLWSRWDKQIISVCAVLVFAALLARMPSSSWLPGSAPSHPVYEAPSTPVTDLGDFATRLQNLERLFSMLSNDMDRSRTKAENEARNQAEVAGRIGALETRVQSESRKFVEAEVQLKSAATQNLRNLKQEIDLLHSQVQAQHHQQQQNNRPMSSGTDDEARAKLREMEDRLGAVEGDVKDALESGKKSGNADAGAAWWNKLASGTGSKDIVIKSSSGQDVTGLINHLVEEAVTIYNKDILARPDYAQYSSGAQVIPSLTSLTYEITPSGVKDRVIGWVTGNGYAIGRPPVTALHHETHHGICWPFRGPRGQLGVKLAHPVYITDFTIDHSAKEVSYDMRSAPRNMEVWGLVNGQDNEDKVKQWRAEKAKQREEAIARGEEIEAEPLQPATLPAEVQYLRLATFTYDAHSPNNIQTFPISQEIKDLSVDFGVVVLFVRNNWGQDAYTCLYRFRVHGQPLEESTLATLEELDSVSL